MLRLRFVDLVPDHAVNVAYVEPETMSVKRNIALLDMSYRRAANVSYYSGGSFDVLLTGSTNRVDTQEVVLSSRSVLSKNLRRSIPLFYKYEIGRGIYRVQAQVSTPADLDLARLEILKQFQILDRNDNKIKVPDWDIEVTNYDGNGYLVTLYLSRRQNRSETFKVRYQAWNIAQASPFPNHVEVINATPILVEGTDYTLQTESDGYSIQGLAAADQSDGIGIFYKGTLATGTIVVDTAPLALQPNRIRLLKDGGGWEDFIIDGKSISRVVQDINEQGIEYEAVPLSDNPVSSVQPIASTPVDVEGIAIKQNGYVRAKYEESTRVRALLPYADHPSLPWYPRVDKGEFAEDATISGNAVKLIFRPQGPSVTMPPGRYGGTKHDRMDDRPTVLGPQILQLSRPNVDPSTLEITRNEEVLSTIVSDYDQLNSVIFLATRPGDIASLYASYSYEEETLVYTGVDLNPLGPGQPELYGKFVGIYMVAAEIHGLPGGTETFNRTIFHTIGDNVPEIIQNVENIKFNTGDSAHAILLGIFRVGQTSTYEDVDLTDTRTRGGGLDDVTEPSKVEGAEEGVMFCDLSLWDGEPFPPTAVVIEYPSEIVGTGEAPMRRDPTADPSGFHYPSGLLTKDEVQKKADRYKAGGVVAIVMPRDTLNA